MNRDELEKFLIIKDEIDLSELLKLGFEKEDYTVVTGKEYLGVQYEFRDYYPIEEDGTQYEDDFGCNYKSVISIGEKDRLVNVEILNNDCSYHTEGREVNPILNMIYRLTLLDMLRIKTEGENGNN